MEIAVRPQKNGSLELEPTDSEERNIIRFYNSENNCIAYIEGDENVDKFVNGLSDEDISFLGKKETIVVDMTIEEFASFLEEK